MRTFADLCSCGGGATIGAMQAGLMPVWGIEYDASIAACYTANIAAHMVVADICDVVYGTLVTPHWLHASTPCTTASNANAGTTETDEDRRLADAVCRAIQVHLPARFSLENVAAYAAYESFDKIKATLTACGYQVAHWLLNAADYGVPQTRKRIILVASLDHLPRKPPPTHHKPRRGQLSMLTPWRGWYSAIEDLADSLPATTPAKWQLDRLPTHLRHTIMVHPTDQRTMPVIRGDQPSFTVMAGAGANTWGPRAFIVNGMPNDRGKSVTTLTDDQPVCTVTAQSGARQARSACLLGGEYGRWVKITPKANARFQTFPDWYRLPRNNSLACRIIGNAVPPLLMQAVIAANL